MFTKAIPFIASLAALASVVFGPRAPACAAEKPGSGAGVTASLDGEWTNRSATHLERPASIKTLVIPEDEVAETEHKLVFAFEHPAEDDIGQFQSEWREDVHLGRVDGQARSSWIVNPADGRLPYTAEGRRRLAAARAAMMTTAGPEARTSSERCLSPSWSALGPPMLNAPYAPNYIIVQAPDAVAIMSEINHDVRVIRLADKHEPRLAPRWTGDSIGRWDGRTLVVETVGFHPLEGLRAPVYYLSPAARVVERFTRISPIEIRYAFTVEDPAVFTEPWSGEMPLMANHDAVYEFACHEGNYSMRGILAGARKSEADARIQAAKPSQR